MQQPDCDMTNEISENLKLVSAAAGGSLMRGAEFAALSATFLSDWIGLSNPPRLFVRGTLLTLSLNGTVALPC